MAGEMPDDRRARPMAGSMLDCHHDISALFQLNWRKRGPFEGYTKRPILNGELQLECGMESWTRVISEYIPTLDRTEDIPIAASRMQMPTRIAV